MSTAAPPVRVTMQQGDCRCWLVDALPRHLQLASPNHFFHRTSIGHLAAGFGAGVHCFSQASLVGAPVPPVGQGAQVAATWGGVTPQRGDCSELCGGAQEAAPGAAIRLIGRWGATNGPLTGPY